MPVCTYVHIKRLMETHTLGAERVLISHAQRHSLWLVTHSSFRFTKQQTINATSGYNT